MEEVFAAINSHPDLAISFPSTNFERRKVAAGFQRKSKDGVFNNVIGCIDGWLCPIKVPTRAEVGNVQSFFSGHYQRYGINVQACCDSSCRVLAYSSSCPGGMGDALAFLKWQLSTMLDNLMEPFIVLGDNAYTVNFHLLTPFDKAHLGNDPKRDAFNFYLSQLRIRVEMTFGLLVNKWGVLQKPLAVEFSKVKNVIHTCIRLHNFCIDERLLADPNYSVDDEVDNFVATGMNANEDFYYCETVDGEALPPSIRASVGEMSRNIIVDKIANLNLKRPARSASRRFARRDKDIRRVLGVVQQQQES